MHPRNISFGILALALSLVRAEGSDVEVLTKDTFDSFIQANELVLAEFYAPWCGHCKALAPEYEAAATTLKEKNIKLAKVDCTAEGDLCSSYGVEGYPTLKVFRGPDDVKPYTGQRKSASITSYMIKQSLPAVSKLESTEKLTEFKTSDKVVLVAYYDESDAASAEEYGKAAQALREEFVFGAVTDAEVAREEGVIVPSIVLYKDFDEGRSEYADGKFDEEAITKFAKVSSTPLIGEITPETYTGYISSGIPIAYIFSDKPEERTQLAADLKEVAQEFRGKVNFATLDASQFGAHAGNLNLPTDKFPSFAIQDTARNLKFPYDIEKDITSKSIGAFLKDFVDGTLEPSIKSEPIPESQDGPVTVVVAKNYKDIVLDDTKDVLLEFYAPWCGHCKALAPKYDELGELYKNSSFKDKVVIAKVDGTANDLPDEIRGFPTIKFYPAGGKSSPVEYSGSRTVEDFISFIKTNGKYQADPNDDAAAQDATEEKEEVEDAPKEDAASQEEEAAEPVPEDAAQDKKADHDEL